MKFDINGVALEIKLNLVTFPNESAVLILEDIFWGEREKPRHQVCCGYSLKKNDPLKILTLPYWCRITSFMELQMIQDYMYSAVANDTSVL
uniref:Uncharacterized protein n=1 Tax=Lactuca sativa TaxID=4236 RepID=A0A9R1UT37_LACSA|nr:hypothetical protein LSAT_V11C800417840 [Lactuca sativa]